MKPEEMTEDDLHAYVDNALTPAQRARVEAHLAACPEDALRVRAWSAQKQDLKALFAPVFDEPLPDSLHALTVQPLASAVNPENRPKSVSFSWLQMAAGVVLAVLGGFAGWFGHAQWAAGDLPTQAKVPMYRQAAVAHVVFSPDARRPVEIGGEQEEVLVKWLSKRLGVPVKVPKLGALGYELVGGRLLPGNAGPVAQFMYQDASGQRLTLFVTTEGAGKGQTGFRFAQEGEINVFYWLDGRFGYALSGGIAKGELARVATAVYDQLEATAPVRTP